MSRPPIRYPLTREVSPRTINRVLSQADTDADSRRMTGPGMGRAPDTPEPPAPDGFWAILGEWDALREPAVNAQADDGRYYQWAEAIWVQGNDGNGNLTPAGTFCVVMPFGRRSAAVLGDDGARTVIIERAREANDAVDIAPGTVVWLTRGSEYTTAVQLDSGASAQPMTANITSTEWVFTNVDSDIVRARLTSDLYGCQTASAVIIDIDANGNETTGGTIEIRDNLNMVDGALLAQVDANGVLYVPSGYCLYAKRFGGPSTGSGSSGGSDIGIEESWYEPLAFGLCCQQTSEGSEGNEGSEGSGSGTEECNHSPIPHPGAPNLNPAEVSDIWARRPDGAGGYCYGWLPVTNCPQQGSGS